MAHRCTIERKGAGTDAYGEASGAWANLATAVPCYAWQSARTELVTGDRTVVHADLHMIVPLGTDVTERDRISAVADRAGNPVMLGRYEMLGVVKRATHIELLLKGTQT